MPIYFWTWSQNKHSKVTFVFLIMARLFMFLSLGVVVVRQIKLSAKKHNILANLYVFLNTLS